jgi:hypothetical protein
MRFDRCSPDLKNLSTRSLPSTLLKKSERRNLVRYHERVVPPPVAELILTNQIRNDEVSMGFSSVSTQSTPYSQDLRDPPSRDGVQRRYREENYTSMIHESVLQQQPEYSAAEYKSRRMRGKNRNTHRRSTTPEWHVRPMKPVTLSNSKTLSKSSSESIDRPKESPRTIIDKIAENLDVLKDEEMHLSLRNIVSRITSNSSTAEDRSESSANSLSSREREIKSAAATGSHRSIREEERSRAASASHKSEVPGLTIPSTSSLDALCSTYGEHEQYAEDNDDRLIITVSTSMASKITTRARGSGPAKDSFRRMDSLIERSSSLENSASQVSGYNNQSSMNGWEDVNESGTSVQSKQSSVYSRDVKREQLQTTLSELSRRSNGSSARNSQRSSPRIGLSNNNTRLVEGEQVPEEDETFLDKGETRTKWSDVSIHRNLDTTSKQHTASIAQSNSICAIGNFAPQLLSASDTQSKGPDAVGQMISLSSRENDILSAAASRKSGRLSSSCREVLIEEREKPVVKTKRDSAATANGSGNSAWRKIDSVIFTDDQSELKLFRTPVNDVAFDDFLTTTSSCSSISASHDPSGYIVNTSAPAKPKPNFIAVRSNMQFDRVKSVLDRMRAPNGGRVHHNDIVVARDDPSKSAKPLAKPVRRLTPDYVPQTTRHRPMPREASVTDDVASARGVPVVAAASFYGDVKEIVPSVAFPTLRGDPIEEAIFLRPPTQRAPADPPASSVGNSL